MSSAEMRFSYTDTAVVSSSPTGRHLSTVIRRPVVLMSGWDEHAAEICKVLNNLTPAHTLVSGLVGAAVKNMADSLKDPVNLALMETVKRQYSELQELRPEVLAELRSAQLDGNAAAGIRSRGADKPMMASGVFVSQDGTVRAETKQRGLNWRGKIPADKTLELLTWAGKGPHTVQQVREKCEELSAAKQEVNGRRFPKTDDTLETWKEYGQAIYKHAVAEYAKYEQRMADLNAKDEELDRLRAGVVPVCGQTLAALCLASVGQKVANANNTFERV